VSSSLPQHHGSPDQRLPQHVSEHRGTSEIVAALAVVVAVAAAVTVALAVAVAVAAAPLCSSMIITLTHGASLVAS